MTRKQYALMALGLILIVACSFTYLSRPGRPALGRLDPSNPLITWQGPSLDSGPRQPLAAATFVLMNTGGSPVRIHSVESGCGCAKPVVQPSIISPGGEGSVSVRAIPFPIGERIVPITVHTDSPLTPTIELRLRMIGSRRPPFLLRASGDLGYLGDVSPSEVREIRITTIEPEGGTREPVFESDLPLMFEKKEERSAPYTKPGIVSHAYTYRVRFATKPAAGTFAGEVRVIDPWDSDHVERIPVLGRSIPPLRAVPSEIILGLNAAGGPAERARFSILTKEPTPHLVIEPEGEDVLLDVQRTGQVASGRFHAFSIALRSGGAVAPGTRNLIVRPSPTSTERLVIPVVIRMGGEP